MAKAKALFNGFIDALLFGGFLLACWLDLTGVEWHQWLGLAVGALAGFHFLVHWAWVQAVTQRLTKGGSGQTRLFYLVDGSLLAGFGLILLSGLIISTWLAWPLENYVAWKNFHVLVTIFTLAGVVVKIGLHWRWIVTTLQRLGPPAPSAPPTRPSGVPGPVAQMARASASRRDFLKVLGVTSVAALLAVRQAAQGLDWPLDNSVAAASSPDTPTPESTAPANAEVPPLPPSAAITPESVPSTTAEAPATVNVPLIPTATPVAVNCRVRCNRRCAYPGRCRRYVDANQNGRCDLGECL